MTIYDEGGHDEFQARHIARWDPARVLAEVEAKRRMLAYIETMRRTGHQGQPGGAWQVLGRDHRQPLLRLLAQPYAGRPGWREEWRA